MAVAQNEQTAERRETWRDQIDWRDVVFLVSAATIEVGLFQLDPRFALIGLGGLGVTLSLWRIK